ncbi:Mitochondrial carrier protein [Macrophomina phaseolina MS6]|uniref:Mitochondrial thiamine pyrophosphate carrier 1 n=2 Tax=Macrophomina phaseolina TaxID=35725 RepID=K2S590_MACPH|nr:Mitochondrial carrier protein [Macrophomina phaseolina MS6]KAH7064523.1 mitochondrial thiamine pyrophosphate carrier 1 [Macrophomina phaseolina]
MSGKVEQLKDEGSRWQVVGSGAIAGLVSRFVIAPLDVIKIRLQLQIHSLSDPLSHHSARGGPIYKGTLGTLKHILREEGLTGLWKGNVPAEALYLCYGSVQFLAYRSTSTFLQSLSFPAKTTDSHGRQHATDRRLPDSFMTFASGAVAGTAATTITYPLDLLRTRFAAQGTSRVYASLLSSIAEIARAEGPQGFFRGLAAAIAQIVPYMGLFFLSYETLKPVSAALPFGSGDAAAGMIASAVSKTAVFPLDTVRKRLQVQGPTRARYVHRNIPEYAGVLETVKAILRREGMRGLYRGLTVSLLKAAPTSAVTMWTYERVMKIFLAVEEKLKENSLD